MAKWFRAWVDKNQGSDVASVVEFLVLEGDDAGHRFTVDGEEVRIGRRRSPDVGERGILLRDPTISASQAILRHADHQVVIEHDPAATNPTLVNDVEVIRQTLQAGDLVKMGRVLIEVRERRGLNLTGLTEAFAASQVEGLITESGDDQPTEGLEASRSASGGETEIRPVVSQIGLLAVERGSELVDEPRFTIWSSGTTVGRGVESDVRVNDLGVSRQHCELTWEEQTLYLRHRSKVNPTLLNGVEITERVKVTSGDIIQLADRVAFRVDLHKIGAQVPSESTTESRDRSLRQDMEAKIARDRSIEDRYRVTGSFLDVDVVNSYGMKVEAKNAEQIIVSFERFRAFVERIVGELGGQVLNSNGDELMCFFESTVDAVRSGSAILERLEIFNRDENLLESPFRFRLGVHTGRSLVDLDHGVAYSAILDMAGHLQKKADANGLVISQQTLDALPEGGPFEHAGVLEREQVVFYRMTGPFA